MRQTGLVHEHEVTTLHYVSPPKKHRYLVDFSVSGINDSLLYMETKGRLTNADRIKMKLVCEQHPEALIVMVFSQPKNKIYKGSKTSYGDWCDAAGIPWCSVDEFEKDPKGTLCRLSIAKLKAGK
jgi:hypothetical protein